MSSASQRFAGKMPILGVCLGHQSIGQATGGEIVRAERLMHGKIDRIHHDGQGLFAGLPNPFDATRYHSLVIRPGTLSDDFDVSAWADAPTAAARSWPSATNASRCSACSSIPRVF